MNYFLKGEVQLARRLVVSTTHMESCRTKGKVAEGKEKCNWPGVKLAIYTYQDWDI